MYYLNGPLRHTDTHLSDTERQQNEIAFKLFLKLLMMTTTTAQQQPISNHVQILSRILLRSIDMKILKSPQ